MFDGLLKIKSKMDQNEQLSPQQKASTPPPVPLRTRNKQHNSSISNLSEHTQSQQIKKTPSEHHQQMASSLAAQLAHRTAMTGSIQSLDLVNHHHHQQQQQTQPNYIHNALLSSIISSGGSGVGLLGSSNIIASGGGVRSFYNASRRSSSYDDCDVAVSEALLVGSSEQGGITNTQPFDLLNGEEIIDTDDLNSEIVYITPENKPIRGRLIVTNFRLFFKSDETPQLPCLIDMPLGVINRIEKIGHQSSKQPNSYGIIISCKDGRRLRFANAQEKRTRKQIFDILQKYAFPVSNQITYFAYSYRLSVNDLSGWNIYNAENEYRRMGIHNQNDWKLVYINSLYKFCDTYPKVFVVPTKISDEDLKDVAEFRSKRRLPVLSWIGRDKNTNDAAILRSSQPCCGLAGKISRKDKDYLHSVLQINYKSVSGKLSIMDARPQVNALANRTKGGGYENEDIYDSCELNFLNIQNIHVMRESLRKVHDLGLPSADDKYYFVNLDNTKWLEHIKCILCGAIKIVNKIHHGSTSVLVHCSDGWDRTPQLTSIAMLMLDKYYRTIKGFEVLIEKEWLSFGHRFGLRMGHGVDKHSDQDRSPVFVQFIDCVWQIQQQNLKVFEFNEKFLMAILKHVYTCQFGTFLYNSEYEREINDVKSKTVSLWSFLNSNENEYKNNSYMEFDGVLMMSVSSRSLKLWTDYYFQYKDSLYNDDSNVDQISNNAANYGRNFLTQILTQMKTSVYGNTNTPEPELIRYRNTLQQQINVDH